MATMPDYIVVQRVESTVRETFMVTADDETHALDLIGTLEPVDVMETCRTKRTVEPRFPDEVQGEG